ncbi:glycoside hydrolase family 19 protein [Bradyrhizobium nanningense]|uniref:glycoside hydrolase family 19 protein n=1 Tax=Bradyrhizobium nanningense TaxID=1325118 RepID=UPI00100890D8|nr:hypothetical protein [Bradyrhizobium nanningense]
MIPEYAAAFDAAGVNEVLGKYRISDNGLRLAHFFAQMLEETGGFHIQVESLRYSPSRLMEVWPHRFPTLDIAEQYAYNEEKLGNYVYGGRLGNTNPGDGFRYRGRGLLQITGRAAYAKYGQQLGIDLESTPELAFHRDHCLDIARRNGRRADTAERPATSSPIATIPSQGSTPAFRGRPHSFPGS